MDNNSKYICSYCGKEFDNPYKLGGHKIKCSLNPKHQEIIEHWKQSFIHNTHEYHGFNYINKKQIIYCQYCNKECKSLNSVKQHERFCDKNPNKQEFILSQYNKLRKPSNQYIKARILDLPMPIVTDETKTKISKANTGKKHKEEIKQKIKESVQQNINNDNWHLSFSKARTIEYKGYKFQGSWEVAFAKYLDNLNIKWERSNKKFDYTYNNDNHKYLPDFYLPDYNLYIEIKGYPTQRDFCKWEQFTDNLDIYFGDDLYNLGIIKSYKDIYKNIDNKFRIKHLDIGSVV